MKLQLISLLLFFALNAEAQIERQVLATGGNTFYGQDMQLDFTIGQIDFETLAQNNFILTQGFQQPNIIITNTSVDEKQIKNISVYPNPFNDVITLETSETHNNLIFELINLKGQKILKGELLANEKTTTINSSDLNSGVYFLNIIDKNNISKQYKIVKLF